MSRYNKDREYFLLVDPDLEYLEEFSNIDLTAAVTQEAVNESEYSYELSEETSNEPTNTRDYPGDPEEAQTLY